MRNALIECYKIVKEIMFRQTINIHNPMS